MQKISIKQKRYVLIEKMALMIAALVFDVFLIINIQHKSMYFIFGAILIIICSVKYIFDMRKEIYRLTMDDYKLVIRFYYSQKEFKVSDIKRVYSISEHNISFNQRYGVVKAIALVINDKSYIISELYEDYNLFDAYICSKFEIHKIKKDIDIIL